MSKFQVILLCAFGFFILVAVGAFSLYRGGGSTAQFSITVWGSLPASSVGSILDSAVSKLDKTLSIRYVEKNAETIEKEFTEALASGTGPDLIVLTQDQFWSNRSKLVPISYESLSQNDFQEAFIEEAELLLTSEGIYGIPVVTDPLVMYYNRDLLNTAGIAGPIRYWDEIYEESLKLTKRDSAGNLVESTVALGEVRNIPNFKEILSTLFFQAGSSITGFEAGGLRSNISNSFSNSVRPGEAAVDFYTQFSNPSKAYYGWNRNLPDAQTHFATGDSVYYLGFASELQTIRRKNPNLNLGVVTVPQSRVSNKAITYGKLYSVSVTRGANNIAAAIRAAVLMSARDIAANISYNMFLPPARRDILREKPSDGIMPVFYEAALQSKGWIDPDRLGTQEIFAEMVEQVTSGRARTYEAINSASGKINSLVK